MYTYIYMYFKIISPLRRSPFGHQSQYACIMAHSQHNALGYAASQNPRSVTWLVFAHESTWYCVITYLYTYIYIWLGIYDKKLIFVLKNICYDLICFRYKIHYYMCGNEVVKCGFLYMYCSCSWLFQCHIYYIEYVMDDSDTSDIFTCSNNICLVRSPSCFAHTFTHQILLSLHKFNMSQSSIAYWLYTIYHSNEIEFVHFFSIPKVGILICWYIIYVESLLEKTLFVQHIFLHKK